MKPHHQLFLEQYLSQLTAEQRSQIPQTIAEYFCADEYNANQCAKLIEQGIKTASCSLKQGYEIEDEPLPQVGRLTVILDWQENPVCIVKLTQVDVCPFDQVTPEFAYAEGEGDRSYQWWHDAHVKFFTQYAQQIGAEFDTSADLVLERFEKVYPV